jgi:hypothetical protein
MTFALKQVMRFLPLDDLCRGRTPCRRNASENSDESITTSATDVPGREYTFLVLKDQPELYIL